jgi:hypothetical protein
MSLTTSIVKQDVFGNKRFHVVSLTFDSSYPTGGESLSARNCGLSQIDHIQFEPAHGMSFEYDHTNAKVKTFRRVPPIVKEELVALTAGATYSTGTLKFPYAFIISVMSHDGVGLRVINGACNPVTTTVSVTSPVKGECPTLSILNTDGYTSLVVTYITQAWQDVFENIVHAKLLEVAGTATVMSRVSGHANLSFTVGTPDVIKLGEVALAIQNITCVTELGVASAHDPVYAGATAATKEAEVDFTDAADSNLTTVSIVTTDNVNAVGHAVYIDYIRRPASGFLFDRWIEEDDCTPSTDVCTISTGVALGGQCQNLLLFGTCQQLPSNTGKTPRLLATIGGGGAVSTSILNVQPTLWPTERGTANTFTQGSDGDDTHLKPTYVWGFESEIETVPLEVKDGTNLASLSGVRAIVIGS